MIRGLDEDVKDKLRSRAQRHGRSIAEEVRDILRHATREEGAPPPLLGSRLAGRFAGIGLEEDIPELRGEAPRPAELDP